MLKADASTADQKPTAFVDDGILAIVGRRSS